MNCHVNRNGNSNLSQEIRYPLCYDGKIASVIYADHEQLLDDRFNQSSLCFYSNFKIT